MQRAIPGLIAASFRFSISISISVLVLVRHNPQSKSNLIFIFGRCKDHPETRLNVPAYCYSCLILPPSHATDNLAKALTDKKSEAFSAIRLKFFESLEATLVAYLREYWRNNQRDDEEAQTDEDEELTEEVVRSKSCPEPWSTLGKNIYKRWQQVSQVEALLLLPVFLLLLLLVLLAACSLR